MPENELIWNKSRGSLQRFFNRISDEHGEKIAEKIARAVSEELGGERIIVPTLKSYEQRLVHEKIRILFTGRNIPELALRFEMTERSVRYIINNQPTRRTP